MLENLLESLSRNIDVIVRPTEGKYPDLDEKTGEFLGDFEYGHPVVLEIYNDDSGQYRSLETAGAPTDDAP